MKLHFLLLCLLEGVLASCHANNCLRALHNTKSASKASSFCSSLLSSSVCASETKRVPGFLTNCDHPASIIPNLSNGCSCLISATSTPARPPPKSYPTHTPPPPPTSLPPYSASNPSSPTSCNAVRTVYVGSVSPTTVTVTVASTTCNTFLAPPPPPPSSICSPSTTTITSTFTLTLTTTTGNPPPTAPATCNFLMNGEFELGDLGGWSPLPAAAHAAQGAVQADPSFDGAHLWVSGPSAPAGLMQTVTPCVPGPGSIIFEGWFGPPVQDTACTIDMCYGLSGGQPGDCNSLVVPPQSAGGWVRAFVNIPLGNQPEEYSVWFVAGCGNMLADAFRLFHVQLP